MSKLEDTKKETIKALKALDKRLDVARSVYAKAADDAYEMRDKCSSYGDGTAHDKWAKLASALNRCFDYVSRYRDHLSYNRYEQDSMDPVVKEVKLYATIEEVKAELFTGMPMPIPKVLKLRKDKDMQVTRFVENRTPSWTAADEKKHREYLKAYHLRQGSTQWRDVSVEKLIAVQRATRQEAVKTRVRWEFKRGPYTHAFSALDPTFKQILAEYNKLRQKINHDRVKLRALNRVTATGRLGQGRAGGVYLKPGAGLMFLKARNRQQVYASKSPETAKEKFVGVELEFVSSSRGEAISDAMLEAGLEQYVCLKTDGSLRVSRNGDTTHELTILVKETEYEALLPKICAVLKKTGGYVNKSCGMHVHLDMRSRKPEACFDRLLKSLEILYRMTPPERRKNKFCERNDVNMPWDPNGSKRYWAINPTAYARHKTIEVRLHSGTLNPVKVVNWVKLLLFIINTPNAVAYRNPQRFIEHLQVPAALAAYILLRVNKFDTEGVDHEDEHVRFLAEDGGLLAEDGGTFHRESRPGPRTTPKCGCMDCRAAEDRAEALAQSVADLPTYGDSVA